MFWGWLWTKQLFQKWYNKANTICVRRVQKIHIFVDAICLGKWYFFLWPYKITKHYKNRGLNKHKGKPKMTLLVAKVPFWEGASKGGFTSCDTQKLCSAENTIYSFLSAKHSFAEIKVSVKRKTEIYQKLGAVCQHAKRCFCVFCFLGWFCFSLCFCSFVLQKKAKQAIFLQFWSSRIFPQKACP